MWLKTLKVQRLTQWFSKQACLQGMVQVFKIPDEISPAEMGTTNYYGLPCSMVPSIAHLIARLYVLQSFASRSGDR